MSASDPSKPDVLGIDFGDTIARTVGQRKIPFDFAIDSIQELVKFRFFENTYIISKVTPEQQERVLAWFQEYEFYSRTGIDPSHVEFCRERHEKADICRRLGVTHMIDNGCEVMRHLHGVVPHRILFRPDETALITYKDYLEDVSIYNDWIRICDALLDTGEEDTF